ncbi:MAG: hypothetical protein IIB94_05330 [Candidatus Marinimicrobia bacterium]|nr:hypothetical protein [Candidatus Neomarinimicrobiota bacterium]
MSIEVESTRLFSSVTVRLTICVPVDRIAVMIESVPITESFDFQTNEVILKRPLPLRL